MFGSGFRRVPHASASQQHRLRRSSDCVPRDVSTHRHADAARVMEAYRRMDSECARFADEAAIGCPPGCGRCCSSPHVEASVLELLPLAIALVAEGTATQWLDSASSALARGDTRCIFFQPEKPADADGETARGRYGVSQHRHIGQHGSRTSRHVVARLASCNMAIRVGPARANTDRTHGRTHAHARL
jgi:hypothetical protein